MLRGSRLKLWKTKPILRLRMVGELVLVQAPHVDAVEAIATAGLHVQAADDVHQGGLAGAGVAHDRDVLAALDDQVDAGEGVHRGLALAVGLGHAGEVDDRRSPAVHCPSPPEIPPGSPPPGKVKPAAGTPLLVDRTTTSPSARPLVISVPLSPTSPVWTGVGVSLPSLRTVTVVSGPTLVIADEGT